MEKDNEYLIDVLEIMLKKVKGHRCTENEIKATANFFRTSLDIEMTLDEASEHFNQKKCCISNHIARKCPIEQKMRNKRVIRYNILRKILKKG